MFNKIRQNRKQFIERQQTSISNKASIHDPETTTRRNLTFFDLPAEIRNAVYEDIASDSYIRVPSWTKKNAKRAEPIPSLLIASKQARQEYLPLLLEYASVRIAINDFDFRNLVRVLSILDNNQLKALQNNSHLTIQLVCDKCDGDSILHLRRWLRYLVNSFDRLPWQYKIYWKTKYAILSTSDLLQTMNTYIVRQKVLEQNLEAMSQLHEGAGENIQFELQPIMDTFAIELERTTPKTDSAWAHTYAANLPTRSTSAAPGCETQ